MPPPQPTDPISNQLAPGQSVLFHADDAGVPVLMPGGRFPLVRDTDADAPQEFATGYVEVFDLSVPDEKARYNEVINAVAKGTCIICREEVVFSPKTDNYMVFCRWMQRFYAPARSVYQGASRNERGQIVFKS
jgi:hypothetical protein